MPESTAGVTRDLAVQPMPSAFDPPEERFETRGELGRGGMGMVHDAFDRALGRSVAIKSTTSSSPVDLARFEREAQITARLEHPGIVPIHDAGRHADGSPFYVMRKVDGRPLDQLVDRRSLSERLALVSNVQAACDALAFAHAKQIIHRDLKPTNILVGPFGETLVIDWGLARSVGDVDGGTAIPVSDPALTRVGTVAGTPGFMAPEQARGEHVDPRSDVFALGATLFFVLAGKLPFATTSATEMIEHVGADRAPDWGRLPAEIPADLRAIVMKAMASEPAARYQDAGAMAADLRRFINGNIVGAHRYGIREQLVRFLKRNRAALAIAAVALVVIVGGGIVSVRRILHERDDARAARGLAEQRRMEADDRSDELLVHHAHELADTDPAGAIAALRRLRPESRQWRAASIAAANAYVHGIPSGFSLNGRLHMLVAAPSSHQVAISLLDGEVDLLDLDKLTKRVLSTTEHDNIAWVDDHTLAISHLRDLELIDLDTAERLHLAIDDRHFAIGSTANGIFVLTSTGELYRLAPGTKALGPVLAHDVSDASSTTIDGVAIVQHKVLALVTPAGIEPLPGDYGEAEGTIFRGANSLTATTTKGACLWTLAPAPVFQFCAPVDGVPLPDGERMLEWSGTAISMVTAAHKRLLGSGAVSLAMTTRDGWFAVIGDGSLWVRSRGFTTVIGRGPYSVTRADVTADGQYFITGSLLGEVRIFRLTDLRPTAYAVEGGETAIALTADALFTVDAFDGVIRYDRKTRAREIVQPGVIGAAAVAADGGWVVSVERGTGAVTAVNLRTQAVVRQRLGEFIGLGNDQIFAMATNGVVSRFDGEDRVPLTTLPGVPIAFRVGAAHLAALLDDHRLCRFALADGTVTCVAGIAAPDQFLVDREGTVWMITKDVLSRWEGSGVPHPVDAPSGLGALLLLDGDALVISAGGVLELTGRPVPRATAIGALAAASPLSDHQIAVILPQSKLGLVDLPTGLAVNTNLSTTGNSLTGSAHSLAFSDTVGKQPSIEVYDFPVPLDPVALRAWLASATNAIPVPDSDVVSWP